jgi:hypothetical protein
MTTRSIWTSFVFVLLAVAPSTFSFAQKPKVGGIAFNYSANYGEQPAFNIALDRVSMPHVPSFHVGAGAEYFRKWNRFETAIDVQLISRSKELDQEKAIQQFYIAALNFKHHFTIGNNTLYPKIGVGLASGHTSFSKKITGQVDLSDLINSRNTLSLYNHQGFAELGVGARFLQSPRWYLLLELGYRAGFGVTAWGVDEEAPNNTTNSFGDELRQFYLKFGFGLYHIKK